MGLLHQSHLAKASVSQSRIEIGETMLIFRLASNNLLGKIPLMAAAGRVVA